MKTTRRQLLQLATVAPLATAFGSSQGIKNTPTSIGKFPSRRTNIVEALRYHYPIVNNNTRSISNMRWHIIYGGTAQKRATIAKYILNYVNTHETESYYHHEYTWDTDAIFIPNKNPYLLLLISEDFPLDFKDGLFVPEQFDTISKIVPFKSEFLICIENKERGNPFIRRIFIAEDKTTNYIHPTVCLAQYEITHTELA